MRKLILYLTLFSLPLLIAGCKHKEETNLKSIMTTEATAGITGNSLDSGSSAAGASANGTMASTVESGESSSDKTAKNGDNTTNSGSQDKNNKSASGKNITEKSQSFSKSNSKISYPHFSGLIDSKAESSINSIVESNAKLALDSFSQNQSLDTDISYSIKNQSRNRISIVYKGTASGTNGSNNIIFTNNINLDTLKSIRLSDFADPLTIAGYILSDDLVLENATNEVAKGFNEHKKTLDINTLKGLLENADFPVNTGSVNESFPQVFSYESGGDIFICIPVPHDLGDYVIAKYSPITK